MDLVIESLEKLISSLTLVYLSPSILDTRAWSLSSSSLFSIESFSIALSNFPISVLFSQARFVRKSEVPSKVKAFTWLVAHKNVNNNDML